MFLQRFRKKFFGQVTRCTLCLRGIEAEQVTPNMLINNNVVCLNCQQQYGAEEIRGMLMQLGLVPRVPILASPAQLMPAQLTNYWRVLDTYGNIVALNYRTANFYYKYVTLRVSNHTQQPNRMTNMNVTTVDMEVILFHVDNITSAMFLGQNREVYDVNFANPTTLYEVTTPHGLYLVDDVEQLKKYFFDHGYFDLHHPDNLPTYRLELYVYPVSGLSYREISDNLMWAVDVDTIHLTEEFDVDKILLLNEANYIIKRLPHNVQYSFVNPVPIYIVTTNAGVADIRIVTYLTDDIYGLDMYLRFNGYFIHLT